MNIINSNLYKAVKKMHSVEELKDIVNNGCINGCSLIYYEDTKKFYDEHHSDIWELLNIQSEEFGYKNIYEFLSEFNKESLGYDDTQFKNMLAWYAIEEIAKFILEEQETVN